MAKSNSAAFLHETLTTAQSFIGESKSCLIRNKSKNAQNCIVLTKEIIEGEDSIDESCVILTYLSNSFHCHFPEGLDFCISVTIYVDDNNNIRDYRKFFNDNYCCIPKQKDFWFYEKEQLIINIFYDKEMRSYAIGLVIANVVMDNLSNTFNLRSNTFNLDKHVIN